MVKQFCRERGVLCWQFTIIFELYKTAQFWVMGVKRKRMILLLMMLKSLANT